MSKPKLVICDHARGEGCSGRACSPCHAIPHKPKDDSGICNEAREYCGDVVGGVICVPYIKGRWPREGK